MISLTGVTKAYGGTTVLDGVTLNVSRGECVRITGAPRSGRTTLLRIIATLVRPTSGSVAVDGVDVVRNPVAARRRLAYVSADTIIGARLQVAEYLGFVARSRGVRQLHRLAEITRRCGLSPLADVESLPAPAKSTLAVAAALVAGPDILLLDDALGAVDDSEQRAAIADAIREARTNGTTLLVASNATDELSAMSSRIVTLERGQLHEGLPALRHHGEATWAL